MKLVRARNGMIMLEFPTRKELSMTMGRAQEYYESGNSKLRNKVFTLEQFIDAFTDDDGEVSYFKSWSGFNIPGHVLNMFFANFDLTSREKALRDLIAKNTPGNRFYVIAARKGDALTMDHEVAHAMFYLDEDYRKAASKLVKQMDPKLRKKLETTFKEWGYAREVYVDELNAYMSTSPADYMRKRFGLRGITKQMKPFIELFETDSKEWK